MFKSSIQTVQNSSSHLWLISSFINHLFLPLLQPSYHSLCHRPLPSTITTSSEKMGKNRCASLLNTQNGQQLMCQPLEHSKLNRLVFYNCSLFKYMQIQTSLLYYLMPNDVSTKVRRSIPLHSHY